MPKSATTDFGAGEGFRALSIQFRRRGVSASAVATKISRALTDSSQKRTVLTEN
jgi:hypothetical protein